MARNIAKGGRDNYPTPQIYADWAVQRALKLMPPRVEYSALEPGCGTESPFLVAATRSTGNWVRTCGVEKEGCGRGENPGSTAYQVLGTDFLASEQDSNWMNNPDERFDLIATNPPFSQCEAFMDKSLGLLKPDGVMVFLLRMAIMGAKKRLKFWQAHMPFEIAHFVRRISFDGKSTDYAEYACFFWLGAELERWWKAVRGSRSTAFYLVDNTSASIKKNEGLVEIGAPPVLNWEF